MCGHEALYACIKEAARLQYDMDMISSPHPLSLLPDDCDLQHPKRHAIKLSIHILLTAAVATVKGAVLYLMGRRKQKSVDNKAEEMFALAHKELRAVKKRSLLLCAEKDNS